ncbi:Ubiquitinyl hydrolase 1 [Purpureocillium takamizusanense]|uniref:ubiquitinyl hydrolase 1 n=1 Tax=Purpureocillium takamizusanense TaxID=2060973 RepID=A0A9Q8VBF4_9HYPO|nr:Ubiquitinyl hydrolase 1 [Purpureocillium takamizusanense]UNI18752.1 Ubiquitinyl hydrolase 1 [Purpureocillium takamizusanense]
MNSQQTEFGNFYEARSTAHRRSPYAHDRISDRWSEPAVVLTGLALLVTVIYKLYSPQSSLEGAFNSTGSFLWGWLVYAVPGPILFAIDDWLNPPLAPRPTSDTRSATHAAKSEAMRRILGLDRPGGIVATVFQARTRALSMTGSVLGLKLDHNRPPGLGNRDNSCYQNSILQGMASLESFSDYLSACVRAVGSDSADRNVAQTLRVLIEDLNDLANNGKTIWTPSLLKSMSTCTQQDAQEYFSKMLDDIDKAVAKAFIETRRFSGLESDGTKDGSATASQHSDDSGYQSLPSSPDLSAIKPLRNPLEGLLAQRVACVQCGFSEGLSMIPFNCLTLSLGLDKNRHDLYERLDAYSKVEAIEGVECPKCTLLKAQRLLTKLLDMMQESGSQAEQLLEPRRRLEAVEAALEDDDFEDKTLAEKCKISNQSKVSSTKTKQIVIARPPQSLAIHVNRSVFDPTTFDMIKNSAPVSFPMTLDLGPWCLGSSDNSRLYSQDWSPEESEEQWQSDPKASMVAGDLMPSRLTGPIYELRAAVTHAGRHENGHYICYRRYPGAEDTDESWDSRESSPAMEDNIDDDSQSTSDKTRCSRSSQGKNAGWWRLSDHNVAKVDEETVQSLSPGVFMLFYECVDPSMVLHNEAESMDDAGELQPSEDTEASKTATPGFEGEAVEGLAVEEPVRDHDNIVSSNNLTKRNGPEDIPLPEDGDGDLPDDTNDSQSGPLAQ